jgi:hypothetical protein
MKHLLPHMEDSSLLCDKLFGVDSLSRTSLRRVVINFTLENF